jgi:GT2 family glycosyltransferase
MRANGFRLFYVPSIQVLHLQGATQRGEQQAFLSTQWIDNLATGFSKRGSLATFTLIKAMLIVGLTIRAGLLALTGIFSKSKIMKERSGIMLKYAQHALQLRYTGHKTQK